jgi:hypothetical protein
MHCLYLELTFSVSVGDTIMKIRHLRDRGDSSSVPRGYAAQILFVPRNKEGCKYLRETVCHYEFAIRDVEPDGLTLARSPRLMPRQPLVDFGPSPSLAIMVCHSRRYITVWQHGSYFSEKQGIFNSRTYKCSCLFLSCSTLEWPRTNIVQVQVEAGESLRPKLFQPSAKRRTYGGHGNEAEDTSASLS